MKILALVTFITISSMAYSAEPDKKLHESCLYPTVMISGEKPKTVGTGVIIKIVEKDKKYLNYVFTCAHIVRQTTEADDHQPEVNAETEVENKPAKAKYDMSATIGVYENWSTMVGTRKYHCEVLHLDRKNDIGLLSFTSETKNHAATVNQKEELFIGTDVIRIGCGMSEPFRLDFGKVTSMAASIGNMIPGSFRVSIPTIMGDSGGGVFVNNELIGLAHAIRNISVPVKAHAQSTPLSVDVPVVNITYVIPISKFYDDAKIVELLKD